MRDALRAAHGAAQDAARNGTVVNNGIANLGGTVIIDGNVTLGGGS